MIVCFYGHKGGAGRSAAVANTAPVLSAAGYRVLIVDFDLEAPGVHRFFDLPDTACQGGVIDLVEAHAARIAAGGEVELPAFPDELLLEPRFRDVKTLDGELPAEQARERLLGPRTIGTTTRFETGVRILPAGRLDERYRARVAAIDWAGRWQDPAWRVFFGWLKLELQARAEVVFLDARAGVTELGALCLFALADRVILLTPPTSQGLDGALVTARALRTAGRGPGDHGTLLVPSRVSKDADREHYGRWLHAAKQAVRDPALLPLWAETDGRSQPERAAEEMLERYLLPELAVHAVGEPLVALRMLERGVAQDDLQDRYAILAGTIQRWAADGRRDAALLEGLGQTGDIQARIEAARAERRLDELPGLYGRLAEVKLAAKTHWDQAREAAELARQGAAAAALFGDETTELRLRVLEGKSLLEASDPEAAEPVLEAAARRLEGRSEDVLLGLEVRSLWGRALGQQEKLEEAEPILRGVWEEADALGTPAAAAWRVNSRRWIGRALADRALLRRAWELAQEMDRDRVVLAGADLACTLGGAEGRAIAEQCRGIARRDPRNPELIGAAEFAWALCLPSCSVNEWTRIINLLRECAPPPVDLAIAYANRAMNRATPEQKAADLREAHRVWLTQPYRFSNPYAEFVSDWTPTQAARAEMGSDLLGALAELRTMVERGVARTAMTQERIVVSHLLLADQAASAAAAQDAAAALDASMRARPWTAGRGGWRPPFVALAPLVLAVTARDDGDAPARMRQVRAALTRAAAHPEAAPLIAAVGSVYLTNNDRRTLLTEALALPDACPEFKAQIQAQLDALPAPD